MQRFRAYNTPLSQGVARYAPHTNVLGGCVGANSCDPGCSSSGVLSLSAIAVARAQRPWREARRRSAGGEFAAARARPAQRGWELPDRAALRRRSGVHEEAGRPQGRVIRFTMNSAESKLFPTAPAGRGAGPGRGRGETTPAVPAEPPQHQTFQRKSRFTCRPATSPTRRLPSSSSRTNAGSFRKTRRRDPTANREPISRSCRSCSTT